MKIDKTKEERTWYPSNIKLLIEKFPSMVYSMKLSSFTGSMIFIASFQVGERTNLHQEKTRIEAGVMLSLSHDLQGEL